MAACATGDQKQVVSVPRAPHPLVLHSMYQSMYSQADAENMKWETRN